MNKFIIVFSIIICIGIGLLFGETLLSTTTCSDLISGTVTNKRADITYYTNQNEGSSLKIKTAKYYITIDSTEWEVSESQYAGCFENMQLSYTIVTEISGVRKKETTHIEFNSMFQQPPMNGGAMSNGGFAPEPPMNGNGRDNIPPEPPMNNMNPTFNDMGYAPQAK